MASFVLVDTVDLRIIKGAKSVAQLEAHAELECPNHDFVVLNTMERRGWAAFNIVELGAIFKNTTGKRLPPGEYAATVRNVAAVAIDLADDAATVEQLIERNGGKPPVVTTKPAARDRSSNPERDKGARKAIEAVRAAKADEAPPARRVERRALHPRPKGGITGRVWEIADAAAQTGLSGKPLRARVVEVCAAEDIKGTTATTQFGRWQHVRDAEGA